MKDEVVAGDLEKGPKRYQTGKPNSGGLGNSKKLHPKLNSSDLPDYTGIHHKEINAQHAADDEELKEDVKK